MRDLFNRLDTWISLVGVGFVAYLWLRRRWRAWFMSSYPAPSANHSPPTKAPEPVAKRNGETSGNRVATEETIGNDPFAFPDIFTGLARLVLDNKIGETEALKIAVRANPGRGERYLAARDRLHAAMAEQSTIETPIAHRPTAAKFAEHS